MLVCEREKELYKVNRRCKTIVFVDQVGRWISKKFSVPRPDQDNGVDTRSLHVFKVLVPFLFTPILVWNVVAYFIQKCTCDLHLILQFIPPIFFQQPAADKEKHGPYGKLLLIPDHEINGDDNLRHLPYHSYQDIENIPSE